jgi:hypothetical protein
MDKWRMSEGGVLLADASIIKMHKKYIRKYKKVLKNYPCTS